MRDEPNFFGLQIELLLTPTPVCMLLLSSHRRRNLTRLREPAIILALDKISSVLSRKAQITYHFEWVINALSVFIKRRRNGCC